MTIWTTSRGYLKKTKWPLIVVGGVVGSFLLVEWLAARQLSSWDPMQDDLSDPIWPG